MWDWIILIPFHAFLFFFQNNEKEYLFIHIDQILQHLFQVDR